MPSPLLPDSLQFRIALEGPLETMALRKPVMAKPLTVIPGPARVKQSAVGPPPELFSVVKPLAVRWMIIGSVTVGSGESRLIVDAETVMTSPPTEAFASRIACRSVPAPESAVDETVNAVRRQRS